MMTRENHGFKRTFCPVTFNPYSGITPEHPNTTNSQRIKGLTPGGLLAPLLPQPNPMDVEVGDMTDSAVKSTCCSSRAPEFSARDAQ